MRRWYGANPLHLLVLLASFALAGYAAVELFGEQPLSVAAWFIGAAVLHDFALVPLYTLADQSLARLARHQAGPMPAVPWVNYVRLPVLLSGLLLLVWFPLILRVPAPYEGITNLPISPYLWRWVGLTGGFFALSAVAYAVALRRSSRSPSSSGSSSTPATRAGRAGSAPVSRDTP